jgi:hypothetical protein
VTIKGRHTPIFTSFCDREIEDIVQNQVRNTPFTGGVVQVCHITGTSKVLKKLDLADEYYSRQKSGAGGAVLFWRKGSEFGKGGYYICAFVDYICYLRRAAVV